MSEGQGHHRPPGTVRPRRFRPRFHWELLVCGVRGHELMGTDAARVRAEDELFVRERDGVRWYRCLRCDSWLPLQLPTRPGREVPPAREEVELPLRGKALRDKIVLRVIAIDRAVHFVVLGLLAVAVFLFAAHEVRVRDFVYRIVNAVQGTAGDPTHRHHGGFLDSLLHVFTLKSSTLYAVAAAAAAYAVIEGVEAVGLWFQRRWAEYLTFVATCAFFPYEVYELAKTVSPFKVVAVVVNVAIAVYLLRAKRLFGFRGGATAEAEERARDVGWEALERTAPGGVARPPADGG
ncbi:MAG TPA: DUF2127 domain-containing protein [Gaiellaceae bacterium]|nr:DUF2127 domain-containing protein [Gaiellaceae bacterium]